MDEQVDTVPAPPTPVPPPPVAPKRTSAGWKVFIIIIVLLFLSIFSCCGLSYCAYTGGGISDMSFGDSIALIHIDGVIAGTGSALDGVITPEAILDQLDQALADDSVKAILLRVDSPGGTVAASQEIAMEVAYAAQEKPVIASIGDVGASGAYMIASQCDEIVALPTSAVGSIGVISQIPNIAGLMDKLGVEFTVITAGEHKDTGSMFRSMTPTEAAMIQGEVDNAYQEFIAIVAEGRDLSEDEVGKMATGWAWSAREAQDMGLVDTLGTYNDAVDIAAELGGIEGDPDIITYEESGYGDLLSYFLGVTASLERLGALVPALSGTTGQPVPH